MTGFLGFDRRRVELLLGALTDLEGERARLGRDTPESEALLVPYRAGVQRLLDWQPRLHAILGYGDHPDYATVDLSWTVPDAIALTSGGRWADVVRDPRRVPPRRATIDWRARAGALAILLGELDAGTLVRDRDLRAAVDAELRRVSESPAAAAALLAALGPRRIVTLANDLAIAAADRRLDRLGGPRRSRPDAVATELDGLLDALGEVLGAAWPRTGSPPTCDALLGGLAAGALGPVLAGATRVAPGVVPTDELVRAALVVLDAMVAARTDAEGVALSSGILSALATDGAAARRVLERLPEESLTALLVRPRRDPDLVIRVLLASSDPARAGAEQVAASMQRVLETLSRCRDLVGSTGGTMHGVADLPPHLGVYIGRWPEPVVDGWGRGPAWAVDHVGWLLARPDVAAELLVTMDARYATRVHELVGARRTDRVADVAYAHAAMADLVDHARLGEALADAASWDRLVAKVQFALDAAALALAPIAPPVAAGVEGLALGSSSAEAAGVSPTSWVLERFTDRPESVRDVLAHQAADRDAADAVLEHVAVATTVEAFARAHPKSRLPDPLPAPSLGLAREDVEPDEQANAVGRDYRARLRHWLDRLTAAGDPTLDALAADVGQVSADVRGAALDARNHLAA